MKLVKTAIAETTYTIEITAREVRTLTYALNDRLKFAKERGATLEDSTALLAQLAAIK